MDTDTHNPADFSHALQDKVLAVKVKFPLAKFDQAR
jgi:hypothetical protein